MKKTAIIVQARSLSTRLPFKVLRKFHRDETLLDVLLSKLSKNKFGLPVIVATSSRPEDTAITESAVKHGIDFFRGDEQNVLKRFISAAELFELDYCVRVCADNPFLDLSFLEELIDHLSLNKNTEPDYLSFMTSGNQPVITTHYGFFSEIVKIDALKKIASESSDPRYLEHVTNYIYLNPEKFEIQFISVPEFIEESDIRLTVDTEEDFLTASRIYNTLHQLNPSFTTNDVYQYLKNNQTFLEKMKEQIMSNQK